MHFMLETHLIFTFFVVFNSFLQLYATPWFYFFLYLKIYLFIWGEVDLPCFTQLWLPQNISFPFIWKFQVFSSFLRSGERFKMWPSTTCPCKCWVCPTEDKPTRISELHSDLFPFGVWHPRWEGESVQAAKAGGENQHGGERRSQRDSPAETEPSWGKNDNNNEEE